MLVDVFELVAHAGDPWLFHQQGDWFTACGEGTVDDFGGFGDEQPLCGFKAVAELEFGEIGVGGDALVVDVVHMNQPHENRISLVWIVMACRFACVSWCVPKAWRVGSFIAS